jgi:hypothetical protein
MCYRKCSKYKYITTKAHVFETGIMGFLISSEYLEMDDHGKMTIKNDYCWNGANCFPDLESIIRGSLGHDGGYQLIRQGYLPFECKDAFDRLLQRCCLEDGMNEWLADKVYLAVSKCGKASCKPGTEGAEIKYHFVTQGVDI